MRRSSDSFYGHYCRPLLLQRYRPLLGTLGHQKEVDCHNSIVLVLTGSVYLGIKFDIFDMIIIICRGLVRGSM